MPALNFAAKFAPLVESGRKRQTIRARRRCPIREGQRLYLYTGMRSKRCRKLGEGVVVETLPIRIECHDDRMTGRVELAGRELRGAELDALIIADGFETHWEFFDWFYGRDYADDAVLIRWRLVRELPVAKDRERAILEEIRGPATVPRRFRSRLDAVRGDV